MALLPWWIGRIHFIYLFKLLFDHYVHRVFANCLAEKMPFSPLKKTSVVEGNNRDRD